MSKATFAVDTLGLVREQLLHGYLNTAGLHATRDVLADQLDDFPDHLAADVIWIIDQLDAELAIRALDPGWHS